MSTWHKSDPNTILNYSAHYFVIWSCIHGHFSYYADSIGVPVCNGGVRVLHIRLVYMGLQTAYAREIPDSVKGNRQYSRSFVYCRKLACSTVSLTGDRVRGDDSKQYR